MRATRARLPADKGLIGFVGGPWTLFVYAIEGSHAGTLTRAKSSLAALPAVCAADLYRSSADNIAQQLEAGADVVMIFDTAAGELPPAYSDRDVCARPHSRSRGAFPGRLGYYAKRCASSASDAVDGRRTVGQASAWIRAGISPPRSRAGPRRDSCRAISIPRWLFLTGQRLDRAIDAVPRAACAAGRQRRRGWICGLGHGVLPGTPEASVRTFRHAVRENFA